MTKHLQQCMGGWCIKRAKCDHYTAPNSGDEPVERLCAKGLDEPERTERERLAADPRFAQWAARAEA